MVVALRYIFIYKLLSAYTVTVFTLFLLLTLFKHAFTAYITSTTHILLLLTMFEGNSKIIYTIPYLPWSDLFVLILPVKGGQLKAEEVNLLPINSMSPHSKCSVFTSN